MSSDYVPDIVLNQIHGLTHPIPTKTLWGKSYAHIKHEKTGLESVPAEIQNHLTDKNSAFNV